MEKPQERDLIAKLREAGFYAKHMDTGVDGFPDIFAAKENLVFLLEAKFSSSKARLCDVYEKSQPVCALEMSRAGFYRSYTCLFDRGSWTVYQQHQALRAILDNPGARFTDMEPICGGTSEEVARTFARMAE